MERSLEIEQRIRDFLAALARGAASEIAGFISDQPCSLMIGTAPEEWIDGYEAMVRTWAGETLAADNTMETMQLQDLKAWAERGIGWAACRTVQATSVGPVLGRYSGVFRLEQGAWRIVHHHVSIGASNLDIFGHDVPFLENFPVDLRDSIGLHPVAAPDGTVTLMFTDIEDSTRLNNRLGDRTWMSLLQDHDGIVRRAVARQHGIEVKHQGDGFMLGFSQPRAAVHAAIEIQRTMPSRAGQESLRVRAGIHHGPTVVTSDDFFGRAVAYAARVAAIGRGGEIVISNDVTSLLFGEFLLTDPFEVTLKGFPGTHRVHRVVWDQTDQTAP